MTLNTRTPLTAARPLIWNRPRLRFVEGAPEGAAATPAEDPAKPAETAPAGGEQNHGEDPNPEDTVEFWKSKAQKNGNEAKNLRDRIKTDSEKAADAARKAALEEVGKSLGFIKDDAAPTPEELQAKIAAEAEARTKAEATAVATRRDNALLNALIDNTEADGKAIKDSLAFQKKLEDIDPTADDFATQVAALVATEVKENERYRKTLVAPAISNGSTPSSTTAGASTIDDFRKAYRAERGVNF